MSGTQFIKSINKLVGEISSVYQGCKVSKRVAQVQKVKISQEIRYAEATKKKPININVPVQLEKPKQIIMEGSEARPCE